MYMKVNALSEKKMRVKGKTEFDSYAGGHDFCLILQLELRRISDLLGAMWPAIMPRSLFHSQVLGFVSEDQPAILTIIICTILLVHFGSFLPGFRCSSQDFSQIVDLSR